VASGERSTIGAISSNATAKTSWSTKARRSAGLSVSRTTSRASPTESATSASCSGSGASAGRMIGSGMCADLATALLDAVEPDSGLHREVAYVAN
jgi:hypothetical protein